MERGEAALFATTLLFVLSIIGYSLGPRTHPRSLTLLLSLSSVGVLLFIVSILYTETSREIYSFWTLLLLLSFFLRASGYISVIYSGGDHIRLYSKVESVILSGSIPSSQGLYGAAPGYILELSGLRFLTGVGIADLRFVTILLASLLPLFVAAALYHTVGGHQISMIGGTLCTFYPLGLRTSALIEAEFFILLLFGGILLIVQDTESVWEFSMLKFLFGFVFVVVHFFYSLLLIIVLSGIFAGALLRQVVDRQIRNGMDLPQYIRTEALVIASMAAWAFFYIIWSNYSLVSINLITSTVDFDIVTNLRSIVLPSSGAVAEGTGVSAQSESNVQLPLVVKLLPIISLLVLSIVGLLRTITDISHDWLTSASVTLGAAVVLVGVGLGATRATYQLRIYYFAGIIAILLAAIGVYCLFQLTPLRWSILAFVLVLVFILVTPLTPFANNIDPKLGGEEFATTPKVVHSVQTVNDIFAESWEIRWEQNALPPGGSFLLDPGRSSPRGTVTITKTTLCSENRFWSNGEIVVCDSNQDKY